MLRCLGLLVLLFGASYQNNLYENLGYGSIGFVNKVETVLSNTSSNISNLCKEHLTLYTRDLKNGKRWAVNMFDSSAKFISSGILDGNVVDYGSFDECFNIKHFINGSNIYGQYCVAKMSINVTMTPESEIEASSKKIDLQLAKCFPDSCSAADLQRLYAYYDIKMNFDEDLCQTKTKEPKLHVGGIAAITFYGFILGMVVTSTAYDVVLYYLKKEPSHSLLVAFSAFTNGKNLLATTNNPNDISCLYGIRVISAMWIVLYHTHVTHFRMAKRNFRASAWSSSNMFIFSGQMTVDTFFLLSGLLISYQFLNAAKKGTKFDLFTYYIHRYLRLMPVLAVIIVFHVTLLKQLCSGPNLHGLIGFNLIDDCQVYWWKTLLFVQNVFGYEKPLCIRASWYLGADMQYFLVSPILLFSLRKFSKITLSLTALLTILSIVACFLIPWFLELNFYMQPDGIADEAFFWYIYFAPHTRAPPWLLGIMLGYLIFETKQGRVQLTNKAVIVVLWIISLAVLYMCTFLGSNLLLDGYDRLGNSLHIALARPAWSMAVAWIIFACVNEYGGPVNWFLSLPVFQVVSKLTYSLYLVHETVITVMVAQSRTVPIFDSVQAIYRYCEALVPIFIMSVILTLTIEFPVAIIEKYLLPRQESKKNKSDFKN